MQIRTGRTSSDLVFISGESQICAETVGDMNVPTFSQFCKEKFANLHGDITIYFTTHSLFSL